MSEKQLTIAEIVNVRKVSDVDGSHKIGAKSIINRSRRREHQLSLSLIIKNTKPFKKLLNTILYRKTKTYSKRLNYPKFHYD